MLKICIQFFQLPSDLNVEKLQISANFFCVQTLGVNYQLSRVWHLQKCFEVYYRSQLSCFYTAFFLAFLRRKWSISDKQPCVMLLLKHFVFELYLLKLSKQLIHASFEPCVRIVGIFCCILYEKISWIQDKILLWAMILKNAFVKCITFVRALCRLFEGLKLISYFQFVISSTFCSLSRKTAFQNKNEVQNFSKGRSLKMLCFWASQFVVCFLKTLNCSKSLNHWANFTCQSFFLKPRLHDPTHLPYRMSSPAP